MKLVWLLAAGGLALRPTLACPADLTVRVEDVANNKGHVLVAVCTQDTFLGGDCPYTARVPAQTGEVIAVVRDIGPGTYAVQAFHDENDNFDIDRTLLGFPKEGVGFSNDAPMRFGPPRFADAAIAVEGEKASARLTMRYLNSARSE